MTAQRGDFERPSPAPSPAARDTWRDQLAERLIVWWAESGGVTVDEVRAVNEGAAEAYADTLLPVLVAAQREAAERSWDAGYAAAQLDADEEPYSDRPERATWQPRQNPHRASALRAGGDT